MGDPSLTDSGVLHQEVKAGIQPRLDQEKCEVFYRLATMMSADYADIDLTTDELDDLAKKLADVTDNWLRVAGEVSALADSKEQKCRVLDHFRSILRQDVLAIPSDQDPLIFLSEPSAWSMGPLQGLVEGSPWFYPTRYRLYRDFMSHLIKTCDFKAIQRFLLESRGGTIPQIRRMISLRRILPEALSRKPRKLDDERIQLQLDSWTSVCADWENWTRVPYGLLLLAKGKPKTWAETGGVKLYDRVEKLAADTRLAPLVCLGKDSVTIRNAFAHGKVTLSHPVAFADSHTTFMVAADEVREQAIDIALSNLLMSTTVQLTLDTQVDAMRQNADANSRVRIRDSVDRS